MAKQVLFPTALTYQRKNKAPLADKTVFDTLALLEAYVNNGDETAHEGQIVSVTGDTTSENNGAYYIVSVADSSDPSKTSGSVSKIGNDVTVVLEAETYTESLSLATSENIGKVVIVDNDEVVYSYVITTDTPTPEEIAAGDVVEAESVPTEVTADSKKYVKVGDTYYKKTSTTYTRGLYIVAGLGAINKLGLSSPSGDIEDEVIKLRNDLSQIMYWYGDDDETI